MGINANVSGGQQITASVGETKIDVAVSGGVGPSGAGGPAATITVGTVTTGAPGSSASVVNAGTTSAAVLNFTIPAGATGATGPQGATGPAGTTTWAGITDKPSTFTPSSHQHVAADISDFTSAVIAAAPPTTNASLLTSGTISEQRIPNTIARTSDVSSAVAAVVNAAPASLDTLKELADALGNDASFATTVTNSLAGKANTVHTHAASEIVSGTLDSARLPASGVTSGTYFGAIVVDATGRITSANSRPFGDATGGNIGRAVVVGATGLLQAVDRVSSVAGRTGAVTLAVADVSGAVASSDARLSDARTPTAHKSSHATGGTDALTPADIGAAAQSHTHTVTDVSGAVSTSDSRLTDARIPTGAAGGDLTGTYPNPTIAPGAVITADIADAAVTTAKLADASVTMPKISATGSAGASTFLRGDGAWATPSASVTYATTAQAQDGVSTTVAMNPARTLDEIYNVYQIDLSQASVFSTGNGTLWQTAFAGSITIQAGNASGGGTVITRHGTWWSSSLPKWNNSTGNFSGRRINWTRRQRFRIRVMPFGVLTANAVFRCIHGKTVSGVGSAGALSTRGIGFELRSGNALWLTTHNGTSRTDTNANTTLFASGNNGALYEIVAESDAAGNANLFLDGTLVATSTGAPTTEATANFEQEFFAVELVTTDSSAAIIGFDRHPQVLRP